MVTGNIIYTLQTHLRLTKYRNVRMHSTETLTVEAKITFTYRLRRTVKVRLVSFPFYGQPFFGTLRKRLKNGKSKVKSTVKERQYARVRKFAIVRTVISSVGEFCSHLERAMT